ncbi:hypothetical protein FC1_16470 [Flavobacterium columnare NBRC 100251 = ATCC 23463]|nr:hypothetical protein [Flavobacterium phage fF4]GEM58409.1 hypothetical protein FC1_16470 [Flavobacterium columnare NBRC 100251 = ATCC 23463]
MSNSNNRRYYLHKCLKKLGVRVKARKKTIYIDPELTENVKVKELLKYNYTIQTEIV